MRIVKYGGKTPLSITYDNCELVCGVDGVDGCFALYAYTRSGSEYLLGRYSSLEGASAAMKKLDKAYGDGEELAIVSDGDRD